MELKTILFVDDEEFRMKAHADYLCIKGFDVIYAAEFEKALKKFEDNKENIDLIILDIMIPVEDVKLTEEEEKITEQGISTGLVLYDRIRKKKKIKTIVLTVRDDIEKAINDRGIESYLKKPIMPNKLLEDINKILER